MWLLNACLDVPKRRFFRSGCIQTRLKFHLLRTLSWIGLSEQPIVDFQNISILCISGGRWVVAASDFLTHPTQPDDLSTQHPRPGRSGLRHLLTRPFGGDSFGANTPSPHSSTLSRSRLRTLGTVCQGAAGNRFVYMTNFNDKISMCRVCVKAEN